MVSDVGLTITGDVEAASGAGMTSGTFRVSAATGTTTIDGSVSCSTAFRVYGCVRNDGAGAVVITANVVTGDANPTTGAYKTLTSRTRDQ